MLSLEPEVRDLHELGLVEDDAARTLIAIERRELFSLHMEVRFLFWAAVSLVAASGALYLKEYADRIGVVAIVSIVALVAAVCYGIAWRVSQRELEREDPASIGVSEYVLLLGALLLSADVGYAEAQFHFLGDAWSRHLLILAIVHAMAAYRYSSRLVLGVSIASLIGWLGIDHGFEFLFRDSWFVGERLVAAAFLLLAWRFAHGRLLRGLDERRRRRLEAFSGVLDHAAVNLGMIGALSWIFDDTLEWVGLLVLAALVAGSVIAGIRTKREAFVVYGFLYGVVGFDAMVLRRLDDEGLAFFYLLVTTPVAIVALFAIHRRWRVE